MKNEPREIGHFMLGIRIYSDEKGDRSYKFFYGNQNVPPEAIITQLRAFIHEQEDVYFKRFTSNMARFDKDE